MPEAWERWELVTGTLPGPAVPPPLPAFLSGHPGLVDKTSGQVNTLWKQGDHFCIPWEVQQEGPGPE